MSALVESDQLSSSQRQLPVVQQVFRNRMTARVQRIHFLYFWAIPNVLALALLPFFGLPNTIEVGLFVTGWLLTTMGVSVGFHRLFTHKSFKTTQAIENVLAILGMMAGGGSLVAWVAIHRRHHQHSDEEGDPHSPQSHSEAKGNRFWQKVRGYVHAHSGWMREHDFPNPQFYCRDLYKKPALIWTSRHYHVWVFIGLILPGVLNGLVTLSWDGALRGVFYGGLLRYVVVHHFISAVNSVCHGIGYRRYETKDHSTNCWWLSLVTVGESWHNNHHGRQNSAFFGHTWWEFDPGAILIRILAWSGLAWDVRNHEMKRREAAQ